MTHVRPSGGSAGGSRKAARRAAAGSLAALVVVMGLLLGAGPLAEASTGPAGAPVSVIVRGEAGSAGRVEAAIRRVGGTVGRHIGIIDGFSAELPESALGRLEGMAGVHSVTANGRLRLLSDGYDGTAQVGSLYNTNKIVGADSAFATTTGKGVGVALIDSGVVPVEGLLSGQVVNGPDLSFESQAPGMRHLDSFGHGTHMAGIIAGRDRSVQEPADLVDPAKFVGVAPGAKLVNVKVASADGSTDVSQVLAAIDWVVRHRDQNGMNIRVINLSFGTDSTQDYRVDPLAHAVEVAWRNGIVVVASAGNGGAGGRLTNPAIDPYVIAVGAVDPAGTVGTADDFVADFSSRGNATRRPDVLAPGRSVVSLRSPSSFIDLTAPQARVGDRFFRGSGTSQAAAVTSGAVALLLQQRPSLTPDQVKQLLVANSRRLSDPTAGNAGTIDVARALADQVTVFSAQTWPTSKGNGSLEGTRGSAHVVRGGVVLAGELDVFGRVWDPAGVAGASWAGSWSGTSWAGTSWAGTSWAGTSWAGTSWAGTSWAGTSWAGTSWAGTSWAGTSWAGSSWGA